LELIADMKRLNSLFCSSAYVVLGGSDTGGLMLDSVPDEARLP
jgi:phosphate:Na+ symporter